LIGKSAGNQAWRARFVPQAEGGREAHPPKSEKIWSQKVNKKERILAIRSALAATTMPDLMKKRGHTFTASLPLVIVDDFENMKKTKEVVSLLVKIGLVSELERVSAPRKVRAGKGKMRGRKYRSKKGFLVIASKQCDALKACRNIRGADAVHPEELTAEHLAPGCQAGRLLIVTKSALAELQKRFGE
jgi:large subunit ribosomal protein L4e